MNDQTVAVKTNPRLMLCPRNENLRLDQEDIINIKQMLRDREADGAPIVLPFPVDVWQFVRGEWKSLPANAGVYQ